jgi:uncharacterized Zn finger protein
MPNSTGNIEDMPTTRAGVPCHSCGWMRYTVTMLANSAAENVVLMVRCSRCGNFKGALRESESFLRPSTSPRVS